MNKLVIALVAAVGVSASAVARLQTGGVWRGRPQTVRNSNGEGGAGQRRPRPAEGREPEFRPPTIREYKPKSTLVAPQHPVPRAKFPVIDIHSHQPTPISAADYDRVMKGMESNNLQILVNLSGSSGARLRQ